MANRLVRDKILRSRKIASLEPMGELFMSVVDDFGRYYADPSLLLSNCFPLRPSWADENSVVKWLEQCRSCGLVRTYESNGTPFLEIDNFGQRLRAGQMSKFPEPRGNPREFPAERGKNPPSRARRLRLRLRLRKRISTFPIGSSASMRGIRGRKIEASPKISPRPLLPPASSLSRILSGDISPVASRRTGRGRAASRFQSWAHGSRTKVFDTIRRARLSPWK